MMIARRRFAGLAAALLLAPPAIVRADSLMPIKGDGSWGTVIWRPDRWIHLWPGDCLSLKFDGVHLPPHFATTGGTVRGVEVAVDWRGVPIDHAPIRRVFVNDTWPPSPVPALMVPQMPMRGARP